MVGFVPLLKETREQLSLSFSPLSILLNVEILQKGGGLQARKDGSVQDLQYT